MKKTYKALGAYIFAGGFTRGVLDTKRFEVLEHLEEGMYGVPTARLNFPKLPIRVGFDAWEVERHKRTKIDYVYGNPPCAAWSRLNGKKTVADVSWARDPRVNCTRAHFGLLESLKPKVWVWESVDMAFQAGQAFIAELTRQAMILGYSVSHLRFDAQYVGGGHRRLRYFMVAHNVAIPWTELIKFVEPPTAGEMLARAKYNSQDDARYIPIPKIHVPAYKKTKPGKPLREAFDELNPEGTRKIRVSSTGKEFIVGRPAFKNLKIHPDEVCPTVVGLNLIHHEVPRHFTIAEMKAVCGYPPSWKLENPESDSGARWDLFTRAVMPPIGKWISGMVAKALDEDVKVTKRNQHTYVIDARKPMNGIVVTPYDARDQQLLLDLEG